MVDIRIRKALRTDANGIKRLIDLVGINPTSLDWMRFLVAVTEDERLVGCGQVKPHGEDILELASIAVSPEFRGQGIGRRVVERLLIENPRPLYLICMSHNGPFYEKFGFQILSSRQMPRYYQRIYGLFKTADIFLKSGEQLLVMMLE